MTRILGFGLATVVIMFAGPDSTNAQGEGTSQTAAKKLEGLLVRAQKVCPVMGKDLTKMGGPVRATVGEQTVFLCCKGCFKGKIAKQHWDQIQANLIAAQGKCPVMGKPLPKNAASIVVSGRKVFVCCPPCTNKIKADPGKYLAIVDRFLEENLARQATRSSFGQQR